MEEIHPALTFRMDCDSVLDLLRIWLIRQSFLVVRNFELDSACSSLSELACPHNPGEICDCHLVILVVYRDDVGSFPLALHWHGDETQIRSIGSRPMPAAIEHCLENAHHDEQMLLQRLPE